MSRPSRPRRPPRYRVVPIDENNVILRLPDGRERHYRAMRGGVVSIDGSHYTQVCTQLYTRGDTLHAPQRGETLARVIRREARARAISCDRTGRESLF